MRKFIVISMLSLLLVFPPFAMGAGQRVSSAKGTKARASLSGTKRVRSTKGQAGTRQVRSTQKARSKSGSRSYERKENVKQFKANLGQKFNNIKTGINQALEKGRNTLNANEMGINLGDDACNYLHDLYKLPELPNTAKDAYDNFDETTAYNINRLAGALKGTPKDLLSGCTTNLRGSSKGKHAQLPTDAASQQVQMEARAAGFSPANFVMLLAGSEDEGKKAKQEAVKGTDNRRRSTATEKLCWAAIHQGVLTITDIKGADKVRCQDFVTRDLGPEDLKPLQRYKNNGEQSVIDYINPRAKCVCEHLGEKGYPGVKYNPVVKKQVIDEYTGKVKIVTVAGFSADKETSGGDTALRAGAKNRDLEMVQFLVGVLKVKPNRKSDAEFGDPLGLAVQAADDLNKDKLEPLDEALISYLVKVGADVDGPWGGSANDGARPSQEQMNFDNLVQGSRASAVLAPIAYSKSFAMFQRLENLGADPAWKDPGDNYSVFMKISQNEEIEDEQTLRIGKHLVTHNLVNLSAKGKDGQTPLTLNEERTETATFIKSQTNSRGRM